MPSLDVIQQLEAQLSSVTDDERAKVLAVLAWEYRATRPHKGLTFADEALEELARSCASDRKHTILEASALVAKGTCEGMIGDRSAAWKHARDALRLLGSVEDPLTESRARTTLGRILVERGHSRWGYRITLGALNRLKSSPHERSKTASSTLSTLGGMEFRLGQFEKAEGHFRDGMSIETELGNKESISECAMNIGNCHTQLGDEAASLRAYQFALDVLPEPKPDRLVSWISFNLGITYMRMAEHEQALKFFRDCLERVGENLPLRIRALGGKSRTLLQLGDREGALETQLGTLDFFPTNDLSTTDEAAALIDLAHIHQAGQDYAEATDCCQRALALLRNSPDNHFELRAHIAIARSEVLQGNWKAAVGTLLPLLPRVEEVNDPLSLSDILTGLGDAFEGVGDFEQANRYIRKAHSIEQKLLQKRASIRRSGIDSEHQIQRAERREGWLETTREELEIQLRRSQKLEALGQLAGGIAHDFNNMLTVMVSYGELLLMRDSLDDEAREFVEQIVAATHRSSEMTRQLLDFSRDSVGQNEIIDPRATLTKLKPMLRRLLRENIDLHVSDGDWIGSVLMGSAQLEQVMINLVSNAGDAMPQGGVLTIQTSRLVLDGDHSTHYPGARLGTHIEIAVSDTGMGMDEATRGQVFDPLFTTKAKGTRTGLGLASVHGIVTGAGGHIAVASRPEQGTTFRVYLPCNESPPLHHSQVTAMPLVPRTHTILVCEDEEAIMGLIDFILKGEGFTVLKAETPARAIELAKDTVPLDLLLTDMIMPTMNGVELSKQVRKIQPSVKVLFTSGYTADILKSAGAREGMDILAKPFSSQELLKRVDRALSVTV